MKRFLIALLIFTFSSTAIAFEHELNISLSSGYCNFTLRADADKEKSHGIASRLKAAYRFNEYIAATLTYGVTWNQGYSTLILTQQQDEEGEAIEVSQKHLTFDFLASHQFGGGLMYMIDYSKVVPYFELSLNYMRLLEAEYHFNNVVYDLIMRANFGLDYLIRPKIALGALLSIDRIITENSFHDSQTSFFLRISYRISIKNN